MNFLRQCQKIFEKLIKLKKRILNIKFQNKCKCINSGRRNKIIKYGTYQQED